MPYSRLLLSRLMPVHRIIGRGVVKKLLERQVLRRPNGDFEEVLLSLPSVFENADFIAFDTEFTGLKVGGADNLNYFDTLDDLYSKDRLRAETFMAIQVGLVAFSYDDKTNQFSHLGYNFFVYPSSFSDVKYTCQSNSIQFLVQHGFDFNKLFKEGIPYLRDTELDRLLEKLTEKYKKKANPSMGAKIEIPTEHRVIIDKIIGKIKEIFESNTKTSFTTDRYNRFIRKLVYNSVEQQFGSSVSVEPNSDESMTISVGFSACEIKEKQMNKLALKKKEILDEVGFAKVIKLLIEAKKLLVGHNLFLDILFVIKQFLVPLPASYNEFKQLVRFLFPKLIDTKFMAASVLKPIKDTGLYTLVEHFEHLKAFPEVSTPKNGNGYTLQDKKLHEAAYDAFLTGMCFLAMGEHFGNVKFSSDIFANLETSFFFKSLVNKISVPRLCDIVCMDLGGEDKTPDRVGVYHLTFPEEWTRDNIMELFKNFGLIQISWINSTSAFVKVKMEHIRDVEKSLMGENQDFRLLTHSRFKSSACESAESLSSPSKDDKFENKTQSSIDSDSPLNVNLNECGRKRKVEEDIGVVLERFQKKHAPADS